MPQHISVHPWRSQRELIGTRDLLFPHQVAYINDDTHHTHEMFDSDASINKEHNESRRLAINIIQTWTHRGYVPHPIVATSLLVDSLITNFEFGLEDTDSLPPFAKSALFATAISRFVTGFCDIGHGGSTKRSMYDVAADLGMPEEWVGMRHEITHGAMPSVLEMKLVAEEALDWLWKGYWKLLSSSTGAVQSSSLKDQVKSALKALLKKRKEALKSRDKKFPLEEYDLILDHVKREGEDITLISDLLVSENLLLPATKLGEPNMKAAFMIWTHPIQHFIRRQSSFYSNLLTALQERLVSLSPSAASSLYESTAVLRWITHLLMGKAWPVSEADRNEALNDVMESCLLNSSPATVKLAGELLSQGDDNFRSTWSRLCDISITAVKKTLSDEEEPSDDEMDEDVTGSERSIHKSAPDLHSAAKEGGWKLLQGVWTPRPIGVLHTMDQL
jgi:ribosomal biogenesis protein LAS1